MPKLNEMEIRTSTKFFAEFFGTFVLLLFGCGTASIWANTSIAHASGADLLSIAGSFGIALLVCTYALGRISGAHFNPALTVAVLVAGNISAKEACFYILAQFFGAISAIYMLQFILSGQLHLSTLQDWSYASNGWGNGYQHEYGTDIAFFTESVLSFIFVFIFLLIQSNRSNFAMSGLVVGSLLVLLHMIALPITGASFNPARSLGPAVFAAGKALEQLWMFIIAPVVGAVVAAVCWRIFARYAYRAESSY